MDELLSSFSEASYATARTSPLNNVISDQENSPSQRFYNLESSFRPPFEELIIPPIIDLTVPVSHSDSIEHETIMIEYSNNEELFAFLNYSAAERILICSKPGSGKSFTVINYIKNIDKRDKFIIYIVPTSIAGHQVKETMLRLGIDKIIFYHSRIEKKIYEEDMNVLITTPEMLIDKWVKKLWPSKEITIIIDESHFLNEDFESQSYQKLHQFTRTKCSRVIYLSSTMNQEKLECINPFEIYYSISNFKNLQLDIIVSNTKNDYLEEFAKLKQDHNILIYTDHKRKLLQIKKIVKGYCNIEKIGFEVGETQSDNESIDELDTDDDSVRISSITETGFKIVMGTSLLVSSITINDISMLYITNDCFGISNFMDLLGRCCRNGKENCYALMVLDPVTILKNCILIQL